MREKYWAAVRMLDRQLKVLIEEHGPDCIVSDSFLPWTIDVAAEFNIPRISFLGTSHFAMGGLECVRLYKPHLNVSSDSEPFLIPKFPGS